MWFREQSYFRYGTKVVEVGFAWRPAAAQRAEGCPVMSACNTSADGRIASDVSPFRPECPRASRFRRAGRASWNDFHMTVRVEHEQQQQP